MFWVGETCSHSEHVFPILLTPQIPEKRVLSRRNVFSLRTRFSETPNSELRKFRRNVFLVGETWSHSEHVFPKLQTPNSKNFGETCSESEKRVLTQNTFFRVLRAPNSLKFRRNVFWVGEHVFSDSEHVFPKLRDSGVRSFGKTCSEWEHVSLTQNTFLRNFRSSELGVSEKRVLSENTFLRLRTRFSETPKSELLKFRKNVFWVGEQVFYESSEHLSPTQNTFFPKFKEFGVRSFGKTCTEWEHVSPTPNTFLRNLGSSKFVVSEKRVLSGEHVSPTQNTFLRKQVSPKFPGFGVWSFGETCS